MPPKRAPKPIGQVRSFSAAHPSTLSRSSFGDTHTSTTARLLNQHATHLHTLGLISDHMRAELSNPRRYDGHTNVDYDEQYLAMHPNYTGADAIEIMGSGEARLRQGIRDRQMLQALSSEEVEIDDEEGVETEQTDNHMKDVGASVEETQGDEDAMSVLELDNDPGSDRCTDLTGGADAQPSDERETTPALRGPMVDRAMQTSPGLLERGLGRFGKNLATAIVVESSEDEKMPVTPDPRNAASHPQSRELADEVLVSSEKEEEASVPTPPKDSATLARGGDIEDAIMISSSSSPVPAAAKDSSE